MVIKGEKEMMKIMDDLFDSNNIESSESKIISILQPSQQFKNTPKQKRPANTALKMMTSPQDEELIIQKQRPIQNKEKKENNNEFEESQTKKINLKPALGLINCDLGASPTFAASESTDFTHNNLD